MADIKSTKATDYVNLYIGVGSTTNLKINGSLLVTSGKLGIGLDSDFKNDHKVTAYYNIIKW